MAITIATVVVIGLLPRPAVRGTSALFVGTRTSPANRFAGVTFSPTVAPVITHTQRGQDEVLTWTPVTASNGATVTYVVKIGRAHV